MYEELQVLSPLGPIREFYFLRYCKQFEKGWAIVDVSYEFRHNKHFATKFRGHRLPSGCFIQNMPNGDSKVIIFQLNTIKSHFVGHNLLLH